MAPTCREERPEAITAASHNEVRPSRSMVTIFSALSSSKEVRMRFSNSLCGAGLRTGAATAAFLATGFFAGFFANFLTSFGAGFGADFLTGLGAVFRAGTFFGAFAAF